MWQRQRHGHTVSGGERTQRVKERLCVSLLAIGLIGAVAGCSGNSTAKVTTGGGTPAPTTGSTSAQANSPTPTPTFSAVSTASSETGAADICAEAQNVTAQPPSTIPAYPNAQLHVSTESGGSGLFGYCSRDQVSAIASFYTQQLPGKGWGSVSSYPLASDQQITAQQGNMQLTITISSDATMSGTTDILIVIQGL